MAQQCLVCESQPRSVRLQCGHIFACADCVEQLAACAICREPILASYNIGGCRTNGQCDRSRSNERFAEASDNIYPAPKRSAGEPPDGAGYVSSGSDTYRSTGGRNVKCFSCLEQVATCRQGCCVPLADRQELCDSCASTWLCPHCGQAGRDLPRLSSGSCLLYTSPSPRDRG